MMSTTGCKNVIEDILLDGIYSDDHKKAKEISKNIIYILDKNKIKYKIETSEEAEAGNTIGDIVEFSNI